MRKLKRSIARAKMEKEGIKQINKKHDGKKSYFSKNWRSYFIKK